MAVPKGRRAPKRAAGVKAMFLLSTVIKSLLFRSIPVAKGVRLLGRATLFVADSDRRGKLVREAAGVTQPVISSIWRQMIDLIEPDIVLDIGANYGEIGLSCRYHDQSHVLFIEGNRQILPYLARAVASHRDKLKMEIIPCLASDANGTGTLLVDDFFSGTSSVLAATNGSVPELRTRKEQSMHTGLTMHSIDYLISQRQLEGLRRLVFKIDVEGYEGRVIQGMKKTLEQCELALGILEFDSHYLELQGTSPATVLSALQETGSLAEVDESGNIKPLDIDLLLARLRSSTVHMDLIYFSTLGHLTKLRVPASVTFYLRLASFVRNFKAERQY